MKDANEMQSRFSQSCGCGEGFGNRCWEREVPFGWVELREWEPCFVFSRTDKEKRIDLRLHRFARLHSCIDKL
jgi:hypothetical protein